MVQECLEEEARGRESARKDFKERHAREKEGPRVRMEREKKRGAINLFSFLILGRVKYVRPAVLVPVFSGNPIRLFSQPAVPSISLNTTLGSRIPLVHLVGLRRCYRGDRGAAARQPSSTMKFKIRPLQSTRHIY